MSNSSTHRPDLTLVLSTEGIIQEAITGASLADEAVGDWVGSTWESTVTEVGPTKVRRLLRAAQGQRVSGFSQINQGLPSGRELLMEFSAVYSGDEHQSIVAIGKNLNIVLEQQQKLLDTQKSIEREYWKLRDIEARYKAVVDSTLEAVALVRESDLGVIEANARAQTLLNLKPGDRSEPTLVLGADTVRLRNALRETRRSGVAPSTLVHLGENREPWRVKVTAVRGMQERHFLLQFSRLDQRTFTTFSNATARSHATPSIAILDAADRVLMTNAAFAELISCEDPANLVGTANRYLVSGSHSSETGRGSPDRRCAAYGWLFVADERIGATARGGSGPGLRGGIGQPITAYSGCILTVGCCRHTGDGEVTAEAGSVTGTPGFGEADLTNCEREQIHLPGSIQPHGALLVLKEPSLEIERASVNAAEFLGVASTPLIGQSVEAIGRELATALERVSEERSFEAPHVVTVRLDGARDNLFDCVVHRPTVGQLIVEFELATDSDRTLSAQLKSGVDTIAAAASLQSLCDVTAQLLKQVLGYSRVMVYRFDADGHGQVFAEQREPELESYLGNHYPASDIPQIARDLYLKNRVRMLADVGYTPVPVHPECGAGSEADLDMSLCHLRSMSPMHIQYLKNMGVASTLVASLASAGRLWGLIACHHTKPLRAGYTARATTELIAEVVATRIAALESVTQTRIEHAIRRLDQNMIDLIAHDGDWPKALFENAKGFLQAFDATGAVLTYDGEIVSIGSVPDDDSVKKLTEWLDEHVTDQLFHSAKLGCEHPELTEVSQEAPGVLATTISSVSGEYLICFRPEKVRTIVWGGDPRKPVEAGSTASDISPRRSFEQWRELLKETAEPWSQNELSAAKLVGRSIRDLVHQIRAVRALIAHSQLETLMEQLERSDIPGLIADADGKILVANDALGSLLWQDNPSTAHMTQIARFFEESSLASHSIGELLNRQRPWRGLATVDAKSVLVRADPVPSSKGTTLGYVVLLTEVGDSLDTAKNARIPEAVLEDYASPESDLPDALRAEYESLANSVLENAQLAVMEIKDGADLERVTRLLETVEDSVLRTTRLIGSLATHTRP